MAAALSVDFFGVLSTGNDTSTQQHTSSLSISCDDVESIDCDVRLANRSFHDWRVFLLASVVGDVGDVQDLHAELNNKKHIIIIIIIINYYYYRFLHRRNKAIQTFSETSKSTI